MNEELEKRLIALEEKVANLAKAVANLSTGISPFIPIGPGLHPNEKTTYPVLPNIFPTPIQSRKCVKCGIMLEGVMSYSCPQPQCPTGMGSVFCSDLGGSNG